MNATALPQFRSDRPLWKSSGTNPLRDGLCNTPICQPELCREILDQARGNADEFFGKSRNTYMLGCLVIGMADFCIEDAKRFLAVLEKESGTIYAEIAAQIKQRRTDLFSIIGVGLVSLIPFLPWKKEGDCYARVNGGGRTTQVSKGGARGRRFELDEIFFAA